MGKSFPGRLYLIPVLSKALDVLELMQKENSPDRKSTRLNSSHLVISYAVFCLKKKKTNTNDIPYHVSSSTEAADFCFGVEWVLSFVHSQEQLDRSYRNEIRHCAYYEACELCHA